MIASTTVGVTHAACWDDSTPPKPTTQYNLSGPAGTVIDTETLLMWKQCVEGGGSSVCIPGAISYLNWADANSAATGATWAGYNDWRLPQLSELQSLVASACTPPVPTINSDAFPGTFSSNVWSGSPYAYLSSGAWAVGFSDGSALTYHRNSPLSVRLVRGGQSLGIVAPTSQTLTFVTPAPTLRFGDTALVAAPSAAPNSGNPVVYASTTPAVCSVNASTGMVSLTNTAIVGNTCTLSANQFGRAYNGQNYAKAAQATQSVVISQGAQSVAFGAAPAVAVSGTGLLSATSNQGVTPITFTSATPGTCTVSGTNGSTVTGITVGTCTITASAPTDATYLAATANQSFSIGPAYLVCTLHMDGVNPMLASKEGLILTRAMLGLRGSAVTDGTGITTPWDTIRVDLNAKCGTAFLP